MPRKHRIVREDFEVVKKGARLHGALFSASVAPLPEGSEAKVTFVVSKKVAAKAVDRNLITRRGRAAIQPLIAMMPPIMIAFYARKESATASYADIERDIRALAEKALSRYNLRT